LYTILPVSIPACSICAAVKDTLLPTTVLVDSTTSEALSALQENTKKDTDNKKY
jgi:hypothetical protein